MAFNQVITQLVAGTKYLVHPQVLGTILEESQLQGIRPVVLLRAEVAEESSPDGILQQLNIFHEVDDVYNPEFSKTIVLTGTLEDISLGNSTLASQNFTSVYTSNAVELPPGPFNPLSSMSDDGIWKEVPVPSRLYSPSSPKTLLAGVRVCVKDIFHLKRTKTTMMSHACTEMYPAQEGSADYAQKLLEQGAIIIGKTNMTNVPASGFQLKAHVMDEDPAAFHPLTSLPISGLISIVQRIPAVMNIKAHQEVHLEQLQLSRDIFG
ncbi:hypothetical protein N7493_001394 [Penicillium malachiteum]|uniref:Amidase domain-containing protein n=1 Tax=Penicillium malachiteum TaxID=1324776 RepID=A0AAD6HU44_9EURO|nr:hypothetical protein N7493_001394 [Penicillium malachiteum]